MPIRRRRLLLAAATIGGVIVIALVVFGVWHATVGTDASASPSSAPVSPAPVTPAPVSPAPDSPTPVVSAPIAPAPVTMAPDVFARYVTRNVHDISKDLNDIDAALSASNILRIASNDEEIEYGLRQLQAAGPPASVASAWSASVRSIETAVASLATHITHKDYAAAMTDVAAIRTELTTSQHVANGA